MVTWLRKRTWAWVMPSLAVTLGVALLLTNGSLGDFFRPQAWGSLLYANVWEHLAHGDLLVDPQYANGEYFIVGRDTFVTYFGVMPALLRGAASLFAPDIYTYTSVNLSMVLAALLAVGSVWYALRRLTRGRPKLRLFGASIVVALLVASPLSYLLVWSWTYHEVILWGVAWALLFVSLYTLWLFDRKYFTRWHGLLMGTAVGMSVLCRPTVGLMLALPYAYLCVRSLLELRRAKRPMLKLFWPGMVVCAVLGLLVLLVNYQRWGSPLTFVRITQNVQLVELFPERREHIQQAGEFNLGRLPTSLYYYLVPSGGNVTSHFPFVTLDRELHQFAPTPHYDYIEGSRVPVTLSMTYLLVLAGFGAVSFRKLKREERSGAYWLLGGAGLSVVSLLSVYALSLRYTAEFVPVVVFMTLIYIVALARGNMPIPGPKLRWTFVAAAVVSTYMTLITLLAYKEFVWDIPPTVRQDLRRTIHYTPKPNETKHIIDGKRFPIF